MLSSTNYAGVRDIGGMELQSSNLQHRRKTLEQGSWGSLPRSAIPGGRLRLHQSCRGFVKAMLLGPRHSSTFVQSKRYAMGMTASGPPDSPNPLVFSLHFDILDELAY
jgi:hypothetical protein